MLTILLGISVRNNYNIEVLSDLYASLLLLSLLALLTSFPHLDPVLWLPSVLAVPATT